MQKKKATTRISAKNKVSKQWRKPLKELFGEIPPHDVVGMYCLVHVDQPSAADRQRRVRSFRADRYFDCDCEMCRVFLEEGSIMIFDGAEVTALRQGPGRTVELVSFNRSPNPQMIANSPC